MNTGLLVLEVDLITQHQKCLRTMEIFLAALVEEEISTSECISIFTDVLQYSIGNINLIKNVTTITILNIIPSNLNKVS